MRLDPNGQLFLGFKIDWEHRFEPDLPHLAVERRTADAEPLGDFRHAPTVAAKGKPDHVRLDRFERADVAFLAQRGNADRVTPIRRWNVDCHGGIR